MATATIYPSGDGTKGSGWSDESSGTTNLYTKIDEGTASPNDSDFVSCNSAGSTMFFSFPSMPSDFGTLTSYELRFRSARSSSKGDYRDFASCQLFKANESTAIASAHTISNTTSATTFTFSTTPSYTDKTSWDALRLKISMSGTGSSGSGRLYACQLDLVYTPSSTNIPYTASGGMTLGGGSPCKLGFRTTGSGGIVLGGSSNVNSNSQFHFMGSGGIVLGGESSSSMRISFQSSGGLIFGGTAEFAVDQGTGTGGVKVGGKGKFLVRYPCVGEGVVMPTDSLFLLATIIWSSIDEDFEVHLYTAAEETIETEADFTTWNFFVKEKEDFFVSFVEPGRVVLEGGVSPDYSIEWDEEEWGESVYIYGYAVVGETSRRVYWVNHHGLRILSAINTSVFNVRLPFRRQEVEA
jgi:hypothetical protein